MVTAVEHIWAARAGEIKDHGAVRVRDRQVRNRIVFPRLTVIGELEVDGCAGDAVVCASPRAEELIKGSVRFAR